MNNPSALKKEAYTSPHLERYGNVRDLTQALTTGSSGKDSIHGNGRTH